VAGIGCKKGIDQATIAAFVTHVFTENGLSESSLSALATVTLKSSEPGLLDFAGMRRVPLIAYTPAELATERGIESPSERVRAKI
jgi:cobalt-precorrin 5A hydrolase